MSTLQYSLRVAIGGDEGAAADAFAIKRRLDELDRLLTDLIALSAKAGADDDSFDLRFQETNDKKNALKARLWELEQRQIILANADARLKEVLTTI